VDSTGADEGSDVVTLDGSDVSPESTGADVGSGVPSSVGVGSGVDSTGADEGSNVVTLVGSDVSPESTGADVGSGVPSSVGVGSEVDSTGADEGSGVVPESTGAGVGSRIDVGGVGAGNDSSFSMILSQKAISSVALQARKPPLPNAMGDTTAAITNKRTRMIQVNERYVHFRQRNFQFM
jgi:hypothetical protein